MSHRIYLCGIKTRLVKVLAAISPLDYLLPAPVSDYYSVVVIARDCTTYCMVLQHTWDCRGPVYHVEKPRALPVTVSDAVSELHLSCLGKSQKGEDSFLQIHIQNLKQSVCTSSCTSIAQIMIIKY